MFLKTKKAQAQNQHNQRLQSTFTPPVIIFLLVP